MKNNYRYQTEPLIGDKELKAIIKYFKTNPWLTEYKKTLDFGKKIANFTDSKYCEILSNGTVTLFTALCSLGITPKDEVIVPDITMIATPNSVKLLGAKPILCDINNKTGCLDLDSIKKVVTKKTKAIIIVSLNGRFPNDFEAINRFCKSKKIFIIEDAAQSLGSYYKKKQIGTLGIIGSFSFSMPKIITTGQGGALVTDSLNLHKKIRKIKDFGREKGGIDIHDDMGWNFKFTDLQSVIGIEQLKDINKRIKRKKKIFDIYKKYLKNVRNVNFLATKNSQCPMFVDCLVEDRNNLIKYLKKFKIGTRIMYPAIHKQKIYSGLDINFPNACEFHIKGLWLPSSLKLTNEEIIYICKKIEKFYKI